MRLFTKKQLVKIDAAHIKKARAFAAHVVGTVNYKDSNQSNLKKIEADHFVSKIGEEAVRKVFENLGRIVKGPDYEIYEMKKKSWDDDLYVDDVGLAVKTQKKSSADRYGLSWTFQASGYRTDPILKQPSSWVCFVLCDDRNPSLNCTVYPPLQMGELILGDPKLPHLKGKKKVAYAKDLPFLSSTKQ